MSSAGDVTVVMGCTVMAASLTVIRDIKENTVSMKPIVGGFIIGTFLLTIAMFSTDVAKAIAVLMLATAAIVNGAAVFGVATAVVTK